MPDYTTSVVILDSDCGLVQLDFSKYPELKTLSVGDISCMLVNELKLIGMSKLESVEIGASSFSLSDGQLYVKNCPKLKSLKIGALSFSNYNVIEIENVDALEEIVMSGGNFWYAPSLELKSVVIARK